MRKLKTRHNEGSGAARAPRVPNHVAVPNANVDNQMDDSADMEKAEQMLMKLASETLKNGQPMFGATATNNIVQGDIADDTDDTDDTTDEPVMTTNKVEEPAVANAG